jgi:hypothetical protein
MSEVYIVTEGEYSDYKIVAVFTDKALATKCADLVSGDVETWTVDADAGQWRAGLRPWTVRMMEDGSTRWGAYETTAVNEDDEDNFFGYIKMSMWARSKEHAIKIANERRIQMLASGRKWPQRSPSQNW